jgi:ABC-type uncharacterized transport system permease subunit
VKIALLLVLFGLAITALLGATLFNVGSEGFRLVRGQALVN